MSTVSPGTSAYAGGLPSGLAVPSFEMRQCRADGECTMRPLSASLEIGTARDVKAFPRGFSGPRGSAAASTS